MQKTAQNWLVYEISRSPFMLGLDAFLGEIPILMFSLLGGVVADRMDRRKVLVASQVIQMTCAFTLTVLFATHTVQIPYILTLSFFAGLAQAFGGPAYQALIPTLVDRDDLPNGIALMSIQFNLATSIGPALSLLAFNVLGAAWCFGLNGISFIAVIISLLTIRLRFVPSRTGETIAESMKQGFSFIRQRSGMVPLIALAFTMTFLAIPMVQFLPVFTKDVLHRGPNTFTMMLSVSGIGSVCGALVVATLGKRARPGRDALLMLVSLAILMVAFSQSRVSYLSFILIFLARAALVAVFSLVSSLVQLITSDDMRGRVMSVYNVAFRGGMPMGNLVTGSLMPVFSAPLVLGANGFILAILALYFLFVQRRIATL
jgi:predicted MFS family arabinose efflux permease